MITENRAPQQVPPSSPPPHLRSQPAPRTWLAVGLAALLIAVAFGVHWSWRVVTHQGDLVEVEPTITYSQPITAIVFTDLSAADIVVNGDPTVKTVQVTRTFHWDRNDPDSRPQPVESWSGTTFSVGQACSIAQEDAACAIDYQVRLPADVVASIDTVSGDVAVNGLSNNLTIETMSGDVRLTDLSAGADVRTMSGNVLAARMHSTQLSVATVSGDVTADFATPPTTVTIRGTSSDVKLAVPGSDGYQVEAQTLSGHKLVQVPSNTVSGRTISVQVTSGDIAVNTT